MVVYNANVANKNCDVYLFFIFELCFYIKYGMVLKVINCPLSSSHVSNHNHTLISNQCWQDIYINMHYGLDMHKTISYFWLFSHIFALSDYLKYGHVYCNFFNESDWIGMSHPMHIFFFLFRVIDMHIHI